MVAETLPLPNIRELFIPDPGYIICDCDLAQADAQVVAWEAGDETLKQIFRDPNLDLHDENSKTIFNDAAPKHRQLAKRGVHAVNYGASARTLAKALGITMREAERFIRIWFSAHPEIAAWHRQVEQSLITTRRISNIFGNIRHYFDRIEGLLPQALAWIPQSTVALVIERGMVALDKKFPQVQILMQVHDSLVFQIPKYQHRTTLPQIKSTLEIPLPYPDPLTIPVGFDVSDISWGHVKPVEV